MSLLPSRVRRIISDEGSCFAFTLIATACGDYAEDEPVGTEDPGFVNEPVTVDSRPDMFCDGEDRVYWTNGAIAVVEGSDNC